MSEKQPEALRLAEIVEQFGGATAYQAAAELRRLHARVAELESAATRKPLTKHEIHLALDKAGIVPAGTLENEVKIARAIEALLRTGVESAVLAERERCARTVEASTRRRREIRSMCNAVPLEPCEIAAIIRSGV